MRGHRCVALLIVYMDVLCVHMSVYRALLSVYRAVLCVHMSVIGLF